MTISKGLQRAVTVLSVTVTLALLLCGVYMRRSSNLQTWTTKDKKSQHHPSHSTHKPPPLPKKFTPLSREAIYSVEKFVFFVGYGRSGHSIIGSLMDAHPNMVIAHEFMLMRKLRTNHDEFMDKTRLFDALYHDSYNDAMKGWRSSGHGGKGYDLALGKSWQGQFRTPLKVIGDKSGGMTSNEYQRYPQQVLDYCEELREVVKIPVHLIHVVRNPFDMIATSVLYKASSGGGKLEPKQKFNSPEHLCRTCAKYLRHAESVNELLMKNCSLNVLELHSEDHIKDPKGTMQRICDFLEVECSEEYLQDCYDKTFKSISRSRDLVVWTEEAIKMVESVIKHFSFFRRYSFENDY